MGLAVLGLWAGTAGAVEAGEQRFGRGKQHLGFALGYGSGFSLGFSGDGDTRSTEFLGFLPRWQLGLSDPGARGSWLYGSFDLLVELQALAALEPRRGSFVGPSALVRYQLLGWGPFVPYLEAGAGLGALDFGLRDQDDGFSFVLQAGFGLQYFVSPRASVDAGWRFHHLSNAGSRSPNNGINASLPMLGVTVHLD